MKYERVFATADQNGIGKQPERNERKKENKIQMRWNQEKAIKRDMDWTERKIENTHLRHDDDVPVFSLHKVGAQQYYTSIYLIHMNMCAAPVAALWFAACEWTSGNLPELGWSRVGGRTYDVTHAKCENNSVAARTVQASPGNKIISDISNSSGSRRCFIYFLTLTICILYRAFYTLTALTTVHKL